MSKKARNRVPDKKRPNGMSNKKAAVHHFWNWKNDGGTRELYLYGTVAEESWFEDELTPEAFRKELEAGSGPVTVWLNSYGGDCVAASQIYTMLVDYPYPVTVKIDGIAASAASVIAMAGSEVLMAPTACMMIHDPMTAAVGNAAEMEKAIGMLTAVKDSIIDAYELKTGLDRKALAKMMSEETWMDCHKAIELGFADGILERESAPVADIAAPVLFSQKAVDAALVNRLAASDYGSGFSGTDSAAQDAHADGIDGAFSPGFIPVKPLYERLERLRQ